MNGMKKTLIGVTVLWGTLLLVAGPARAQGPDCRAEQAAMRGLGAPDAAVREALLPPGVEDAGSTADALTAMRSEEHTSELQSLMRSSYAVFCLKKKKNN